MRVRVDAKAGRMKIKTSSVVWGVLLILLGAIALAQQLDWFAGWDTLALVVVLSILAVIAFVGYLASGWRNWGLLFPAAGLGGGALVAWLVEESATPDEVAGGLFMIIISIPFWIGFLVDRKRSWWALARASISAESAVSWPRIAASGAGPSPLSICAINRLRSRSI